MTENISTDKKFDFTWSELNYCLVSCTQTRTQKQKSISNFDQRYSILVYLCSFIARARAVLIQLTQKGARAYYSKQKQIRGFRDVKIISRKNKSVLKKLCSQKFGPLAQNAVVQSTMANLPSLTLFVRLLHI